MTQAAEKPKIDPIYMSENTYFFHPEDTLEAKIHELYIESMYPGTEAMIVSELIVPRLTDRNHIIVLSRPHMLKKPATKIYRDPMTLQKLSDVIPPEDLISTVHESPAIAVGKFIQGSNKRSIGRFDSNAFFDELSKHMYGGKLRGQPSENTVRYLIG